MAGISYDDFVAKMTLQNANISKYTAETGATAAEIADITNDLGNLVYANDFADVAEGNKKGIFKVKQAIFNGDENVPVPEYPEPQTGTLPNPAKAGAYQRFLERGRRWRTSPLWSEDIAPFLGYDGPGAKPVPAEVKPSIILVGAAHDAHFSVVVSDRGEARAWDGYVQRKGGSWKKEFNGEGKSLDVHLELTTPGEAEQIMVYIQLRKSNENYGQPSDPAYVTLNP